MRHPIITTLFASALLLAGCSGQKPAVATAYNDQYGAVKTSSFDKCPAIEGVWHLGALSAGSFTLDDGQIIQHFRWFAPYLFGLSVSLDDYIAIEQRPLETVLYLAHQVPGPGGKSMGGYTTLSDTEMPCVGYGWRRVATRNHSTNDAAARVLNLVPEQPVEIVQTDYVAQTPDHELLIAIRIDYSGTDSADKSKQINEGYWHFMKMKRLYDDPKAQGFKS